MSARKKNARGVQIAGAVVIALVTLWIRSSQNVPHRPPDVPAARGPQSSPISQLAREHRSGEMVQASGAVVNVLPDDTEGDRHQRFIVRLSDATTVLIAHNIDLAPRAPVREGMKVDFRGEYQWNERGGIVHWTHHDPADRHAGGWIRVDDKLYQ